MNGDLISRSALLKKVRICKEAVGTCANHDYMIGYASAMSGVEGQICEEPAIDAEYVVHCRDCKHLTRSPWNNPEFGWCKLYGHNRKMDYYCASASAVEE